MTTKQITYAKVSGYDAAVDRAGAADVTVIAGVGELGPAEMTQLGDDVVGLVCAGKCNLVLDLTGASHLDYRTVKPLVARTTFVRSSGGDLKLCGLSPYLHAIFRAAGAWSEFEIYDDAAAASAAFAADLA